MNIYYISNMFPSETKNDNYGIFCKKVYDFLQDKTLKISLLSVIRGKSFNRLYNLFRYLSLIIEIWFKIIFYNNKFDIIYFQYVWIHVFSIYPLFKYLKRKHKKIVINFHGEDLLAFIEHPKKGLFNKILTDSDLIIIPSNYYKTLLDSEYSINKQKLFVSASGGVDRNIFIHKERSSYGHKIVFCSRFAEYKGWKDFVENVFILKKNQVNVEAIMIGYGEDMDLLQKQIKNYELNDYITVKTNLSHEQIASEYAESDLFLFPTIANESLGLVALEAMSCGVPVIGSNIAALPEYIHNGENGFLVDIHSPEQLAEKVEEYFAFNDEMKAIFVKNALKTASFYETNWVVSELRKKLLTI